MIQSNSRNPRRIRLDIVTMQVLMFTVRELSLADSALCHLIELVGFHHCIFYVSFLFDYGNHMLIQ